jgi:hypothetical protein
MCLLMRDGHLEANLQSGVSISVARLADTKKIVLRRGVWFRSLSRVERGIIDLTVRYVDNIKSIKLAKIVTAIIRKLQYAMESSLDKLVRSIGLPLTLKISEVAIKCGNCLASKWAADRGFARYLAICFCQER